MRPEVREVGDVEILEFTKELTVQDPDALGEAVKQALERGRTRFVLDLSTVRHVHSAMIGEICACYKRARERGGGFKLLLEPGGKVEDLFRLVGLDKIFEVFGSEADAVASFDG